MEVKTVGPKIMMVLVVKIFEDQCDCQVWVQIQKAADVMVLCYVMVLCSACSKSGSWLYLKLLDVVG